MQERDSNHEPNDHFLRVTLIAIAASISLPNDIDIFPLQVGAISLLSSLLVSLAIVRGCLSVPVELNFYHHLRSESARHAHSLGLTTSGWRMRFRWRSLFAFICGNKPVVWWSSSGAESSVEMLAS